MSHVSPKPPIGEADAGLLEALYAAYPGGETFDEYSISAHVSHQHPGLREPLATALGLPHLTLGRGGFLPERRRPSLRRWLDRMEGRPAAGLVLRHDRIGWSRVEPAEPPVLPAVRTASGDQLAVWCDDCGRKHLHGAPSAEFGSGDGHRLAHCDGDGPNKRTGYVLREVRWAGTGPTGGHG